MRAEADRPGRQDYLTSSFGSPRRRNSMRRFYPRGGAAAVRGVELR